MGAVREGDINPLVAVVEDEPGVSSLVARCLKRGGYQPIVYPDAETFMEGLALKSPDAVFLDIDLPGLNGLDALQRLQDVRPGVPVIMLSGAGKIEQVVTAMRRGAFDYVTKPFETDRLLAAVSEAVQAHQSAAREISSFDGTGRFGPLVGRSPAMKLVFRQIQQVASSSVTVLLHGESGTGKELVASAIHQRSHRADKPFVALNCAAIPESLQDSELFGHERGAFTGAQQARAGRFEQSNHGTLFLDELGELSLPLQAKLLRVLQERKFERIGGNRTIESDFRLVAATHRNLRAMVKAGTFREDLYFRIAVFEISLPPLRERGDDIDLLLAECLAQLSTGRSPPQVSDEVRSLLRAHPWPGNIRELYNVLQRAVLVSDGQVITAEHLPSSLAPAQVSVCDPERNDLGALTDSLPVSTSTSSVLETSPRSLEEMERAAIERMLLEVGENHSEAARRLGIARTTLYRKLRRYGLR